MRSVGVPCKDATVAPPIVVHMVAQRCGRRVAPQQFVPRQAPPRTGHQLLTAAHTIGHRHMAIIPRRLIRLASALVWRPGLVWPASPSVRPQRARIRRHLLLY